MKRLLIKLIQFYLTAISPRKPAMCKYIPTCSQYGLEAIQRLRPRSGKERKEKEAGKLRKLDSQRHEEQPISI